MIIIFGGADPFGDVNKGHRADVSQDSGPYRREQSGLGHEIGDDERNHAPGGDQHKSGHHRADLVADGRPRNRQPIEPARG